MGIITSQYVTLYGMAEADLHQQEMEKRRIAEERRLEEERQRAEEQRREEERRRVEYIYATKKEIEELENSLEVSTFGLVLRGFSILMLFGSFSKWVAVWVRKGNPFYVVWAWDALVLLVLCAGYLTAVFTRKISKKRKISRLKKLLDEYINGGILK